MYKAELLMYLKESTKLPAKETLINGDGTAKLLADILGVSEAAVSYWGELLPLRRAMQINKVLYHDDKQEEREKFGLLKDGLLIKGAPELDLDLYE